MNKKLLKLLLLPCLILPSFSCGNNGNEFKQASHDEFALKAIKCINEPDTYSKVIMNGTCEVYENHEIKTINNAIGMINEKELTIENVSRLEDDDLIYGSLRMNFTPYYYIYAADENYTYYVNDTSCRIEYDVTFYGCSKTQCGETYHNIISWNNYGLLDYFEFAFTRFGDNIIRCVLKLNFSYE